MTSVARWESRLHQSLLCPHRPKPGPSPRCQRARVPNPAVCSRPPFFSTSLFPLRPRPTLLTAFSLLFSLLPPHTFLFFAVCYSSSFLASRPSATAPRCGQLFNTSPPRQEGLVSDFCSPEEIWRSNPLSSIFYFFLIYSRVKLKGKKGRGLTAQQESLLSFPRIPLFRTVSHIHQEAQLPRRPHTTQRLHTHSPSLNIWASYTASHMFPLSAPLTFGPSVQ